MKRILDIRVYKALRSEDLKKLRVAWNRAKYFVVTADSNAELANLDKSNLQTKLKPASTQLMLFDTQVSTITGEI